MSKHDSDTYKFRIDHTEAFNNELDNIEKNYTAMIETLAGWMALVVLEEHRRYGNESERDIQLRLTEVMKLVVGYTKGIYEVIDRVPSANLDTTLQ